MDTIAQYLGYLLIAILVIWGVIYLYNFLTRLTLALIMARSWAQERRHHEGKCGPKCRYCIMEKEREDFEAIAKQNKRERCSNGEVEPCNCPLH